ncbi:hypothetical protein EYZ11_013014 [Aspergillus tanneri]|uniref:Uncharacterized protein n=1 Tax=Aspergillus tanneri TaxID=1220188 RepID=A0A4S3J456_9EURO|nr:hypothetical protein EYZ11_013014 [Aspergillus tanneri]
MWEVHLTLTIREGQHPLRKLPKKEHRLKGLVGKFCERLVAKKRAIKSDSSEHGAEAKYEEGMHTTQQVVIQVTNEKAETRKDRNSMIKKEQLEKGQKNENEDIKKNKEDKKKQNNSRLENLIAENNQLLKAVLYFLFVISVICSEKKTQKTIHQARPTKMTPQQKEMLFSTENSSEGAGANTPKEDDIDFITKRFERRDRLALKASMPVPGTPGAPYFTGQEVTNFLRVMKNLFKRHLIDSDKEKLELLADYSSATVATWISTLAEYETGDFEGVASALKEEYSQQDSVQKIISIHWLTKFVEEERREDDDVGKYLRTFHYVSGELEKMGHLNDYYIRARMLLKGLPETMRQTLIQKERLDPRKLDYKSIKEKVEDLRKLARTFEQFKEEITPTGKTVNFTEFTDPQEQQSSVMIKPNGELPLKVERAKELEAGRTENAELDKLTKQMEELKLSFIELSRKSVLSPQEGHLNRNNAGSYTRNCRFCAKPEHFMDRCLELDKYTKQSVVHIGPDRRVYWGPEGAGGEPLKGGPNQKPMLEQVQERLRDKTYSANLITLEGISSETEEEDLEVVGSGPRTSQNTPPWTVAATKRARLEEEAREEEEIPAVKTYRPGAYSRPDFKGKEEKGSPAKIQRNDQPSKGPEKDQAPKMQKVKLSDLLKGNGPVEEIKRKILQQKIELTTEELIRISPELHKLMFAPQDRWSQLQPRVDEVAFEEEEIEEDKAQYFEALCNSMYYAIRTLEVGVTIKAHDSSWSRKVMIDSGAEINLLHRDFTDNLGLPSSLFCGGRPGVSRMCIGQTFYAPVSYGTVHEKRRIGGCDN